MCIDASGQSIKILEASRCLPQRQHTRAVGYAVGKLLYFQLIWQQRVPALWTEKHTPFL